MDLDRERLSNAVAKTATSFEPRIQVTGSFQRGDFHLARHRVSGRLWSMSDLDLVLRGCDGPERIELAKVLHSRVVAATGIDIPVSVQGADHFSSLSRHDSTVIAIAEFVRRVAHAPGRVAVEYQRAKLALRIAGHDHPLPRPMMARLSEIKLRIDDSFDFERSVDWEHVLKTSSGSPALSALALQACTPAEVPQVAARLIDLLPACRSISPWLLDLMTGLLDPIAPRRSRVNSGDAG